MEFPFFHIKRRQAAKIQSSPRTFFSSPVVGLHSVGRFISGRFCRVCLGTGEFLRPQGAIPQAYTPFGGGLLPGAWGAPKRGMPTGPKVFLALPDACGLRPCDRVTLKTALCHIRALVWRFDKYRGPRGLFFLSSCWVALGRPFYLWTVLPGVPRHWRFPPASGGHTPRLIPPSGGLGLLPGAWSAPKRGRPTGPKVFLALPDACWLRPCDRAHLKNSLVPYSCVGGTLR